MAFIDAEIDRRLRPPSPTSTAGLGQDGAERPDHTVHRQPAALGRIVEIDLGPDATAKNVAAIELARAIKDGTAEIPALEVQSKRWKGKGRRKRRTSEDLQRDQIVEQVLRENRRMFPCQPPRIY